MAEFRNGLGWDIHRIAPGRPLIQGGSTIPSEFGLEGTPTLIFYCTR